MVKLEDLSRSQEQIFNDLVKVPNGDKVKFVDEVKNLVGENLSKALLQKGLSESNLIEYLRTTYMARSTIRSPSVNIIPTRKPRERCPCWQRLVLKASLKN